MGYALKPLIEKLTEVIDQQRASIPVNSEMKSDEKRDEILKQLESKVEERKIIQRINGFETAEAVAEQRGSIQPDNTKSQRKMKKG